MERLVTSRPNSRLEGVHGFLAPLPSLKVKLQINKFGREGGLQEKVEKVGSGRMPSLALRGAGTMFEAAFNPLFVENKQHISHISWSCLPGPSFTDLWAA